MASVSVIGVGRIGGALVDRLGREGHSVTAFDIRPERRAVVEEAGGTWADNLPDAVSAGQLVFTVLPGSPELLALTATDWLRHLRPEAVWVDLTSASPDASRACSERAAQQGIGFLDAPLAGGAEAVRTGVAALYVGGDGETLQAALPVLRSFAEAVHHVGASGTGHLAKLVINLLWFGQVGLVTEALLLAQRSGLDPQDMRALLLRSAAASTFVAEHLPSLLRGDYLAEFGLDRCVEELTAVESASMASGLPHAVTSAVAEVHRAALRRFGPVEGELLAAAWLEEQAGTRLTGA